MAFDVLSRPYHSSGEWWLSSGQLELKCQLKCETLRFGFLINLSRESLLLDALHPKDWLFLYLHRLPSLTPLSDRCSIHGCTYVLMSAFLFSALIHKKWEIQSIVSLFSPLTGSDTVKNERARMSMHAAFAKKKTPNRTPAKMTKQCTHVLSRMNTQTSSLRIFTLCLRSIFLRQVWSALYAVILFAFLIVLQRLPSTCTRWPLWPS